MKKKIITIQIIIMIFLLMYIISGTYKIKINDTTKTNYIYIQKTAGTVK